MSSIHRCLNPLQPMKSTALPFFTIGHSTRAIEDFVALLRAAGVSQVADVRKMPRSRTNPQFNDDVLGNSLAGFQIRYEHIASLGGLRGRQLPRETSPNTLWKNRSFRNYADYALSADFHKGLNRLIDLGRERRTAFMCAEAVWWRCHRRIITDYLLAAGEQVFHIFDVDYVVGAEMTPGAQPDSQGRVVYPGS
jgi:uncharacterized protein (DUF488 family)